MIIWAHVLSRFILDLSFAQTGHGLRGFRYWRIKNVSKTFNNIRQYRAASKGEEIDAHNKLGQLQLNVAYNGLMIVGAIVSSTASP